MEQDFPAYLVTRTADGVQQHVGRLRPEDLPPGEVLVEVQWSAVNFKDGMVTQPGNRVARISPLVPGVDLAGVVRSSDDPRFASGQEVLVHGHDLGVAHHGGFATYARVPAGWVVPLPAGLTTRQAMIIGTAGFTAALSLVELERRGLQPGDGPVLVTGASGGVGSQAVALLAGRGYEVVASSGKVAEHGWLRQLGASEVIGRDDLDVDSKRTLGPERWAGAVDCVGGQTLTRVLRTLRYGAGVAASGLTGGTELQTTVYPFIIRSVALLGVDSVETPGERRRQVWQRLGSDLRPPDLDALVDREVTLHTVGAALADIAAARIRGRVVVRVGA